MVDAGSRCATHPASTAVDTCARCGNFVCAPCMEIEEWDVYCPPCFARVGKSAPASTRATAALVMALVAVSGCVPLALPALVLGHMEMSAIERGESEPGGRNLAKGAIWVGWLVCGFTVLALLVGVTLGFAALD